MSEPVPILLMARELGLGGTERQLTEIARALDRSRFAPHVGCLHAEGLRGTELETAGVPIVRFPVQSLYRPSTISAAREMGGYLKQHRIQLVHTFDVPMNLFGVPVARAYRTPVVLSSQRAFRDLTPGMHRRLLRVTDRLVDGVVVNCEAIRQHLISDEGVPAGRIDVCYNGIDTEVFRPGLRTAGEQVSIGIVCALRPEKGLPTLVKAFSEVPGARLIIVGSGPMLGELQGLAGSLGVQDRCHFEPATNRVTEWLRKIDIFVLPSLSEALSNSLMEAMACGCAVTASSTGGNVELVHPDVTGLLFPPGDAAALASNLLKLVASEPLRKDLGANASRMILDGFSLKQSAARMADIYQAHLR
ncbi:MAG: glycosyltransferase family 4 protein [Bryobacteraceae bacterium]